MRDTSKLHYEALWDSLRILPDWRARVNIAAHRIARMKHEYVKIERAIGIPWAVAGVIHDLECSCDPVGGYHNGERWDRVTTLVPAGKGPFDSLAASGIDALWGLANLPSWTIGEIGWRLERYNGMGYAKRDAESPYLWSGSNHGIGVGKYVADGRYDPNAVSQQVGAMCSLRMMIERSLWDAGPLPKIPANRPIHYRERSDRVAGLQRLLADQGHNLGAFGPQRDGIDGVAGRLTATAIHALLGAWITGTPEEIIK